MPERVDNHGIMEELHLQSFHMQAWLAGPNSAGPAARQGFWKILEGEGRPI